MTSNLSRRYVESVLTGEVRCTDGTLVVFVPPPEGSLVLAKRKPKKPAPAAVVRNAAVETLVEETGMPREAAEFLVDSP